MFSPLDYAVLLAYFALCAFVGWYAGRGQKDAKDYFKGGGRMPTWAVCLSILATETSALTFCSVPGLAYTGDCCYLLFVCGSLLGRVLVGTLFVAAFYAAGVTTVYEYLGKRFGPATRGTASILFLITRTLADGVRLTAASLAVQAATGWPFAACVLAFAAVTVLYSVFGGIKSIIWTDVLQFFLFVGGAVAALVVILGDVGTDGVTGALAAARDAGVDKLRVLDPSFDLTKKFTVWSSLIGGMLLTFATHGTDQDIAQRVLTCRESRQGSRSVILSGVVNIPMVMLFLGIGVCLYAFYFHHGDLRAALPLKAGADGITAVNPDRIFPHFIVHQLAPGVRGLVLAAVFAAAMSTTSSAIGALTSVAVIDVYKRVVRREEEPARDLRVSRWVAGGVSLVLVGIALLFERAPESLLNEGLQVLTYGYGALLGVFFLGRVTRRRGGDLGNVAAMGLAIAAVLAVKFLTRVAWPWYIVVGFAVSFGVGVLFRAPSELASPAQGPGGAGTGGEPPPAGI